MEIRQLEYFLAVVDEGGYSRAAERLHLSQPSLSQAVHKLERELGIALFRREGRRSVLTTEGESLVPMSRRVLASLNDIREIVNQNRDLIIGSVAVSTVPALSLDPLTGLISNFLELYPGVSVKVSANANAEETIDDVRSGRASVGLVGMVRSAPPPRVADVTARLLGLQELLLITPADGASASGGPVPVQALQGRRFVVGEDGTTVRALTDELVRQGIDIEVVVETEHRVSAIALVEAGVGCTLLPQPWEGIARGFDVEVSRITPSPQFGVWLVTNDQLLTFAAAKFVEFARTWSKLPTTSRSGPP